MMQDSARHVPSVGRPFWWEGELALCVDILNGIADGIPDEGDFGLLQGPLQANGVLRAGIIQCTGQSDILGCPDFF